MRPPLWLLIAWGTLSLGCFVSAVEPNAEARWKYTGEGALAADWDPIFRSLPLSAEKPAGITEKVTYRGRRQLYGQWRYGSEGSTRVLAVLDEVSRDDFDLYLDRDRSRSIAANEKIAGTGRVRIAPLDAEIRSGDAATHLRRTVILRRSATSGSLGIATAGYVEGRVNLAGKSVTARRVDGDANGLFADAADRLWFDLDGNGRWDAFAEQFPFLPVLRLAGRRFAVRADPLGQNLALDELTGEGRLRLRLPALAKGATVTRIEVSLTDGNGSAYSIQGIEKAVAMPVGKFAPYAVTLHVQDGLRPEPWCVCFSYNGAPRKWYEVQKDQEFVLDPFGKFRFELETSGDEYRPGENLGVRPRLYTHDGLLISSCSFGEADRSNEEKHNCATMQLLSGGEVVATAQSGFA